MRITFNRVLCMPFEFGLPLEDIFPPNDIHPQLKELFELAYLSCYQSSMNLSDTLRFQGSIEDRLNLKDKFLNRIRIKSCDHLPGSYLWLIRHYLGLVPLSVFPKYTNGRNYDWEKLAVKCKLYLYHKQYNVLDAQLSQSISYLPACNIMLVQDLLHFLRKVLLIYSTAGDKLDWKNVLLFTKFFSSSLFLRPYRPGHSSRVDKLYYPLTFYLISQWPKLEHTYLYLLHKKRVFLYYKEFPEKIDAESQTSYCGEKDFSKLSCCCKIGRNYETTEDVAESESSHSLATISSLEEEEIFEPQLESTQIEEKSIIEEDSVIEEKSVVEEVPEIPDDGEDFTYEDNEEVSYESLDDLKSKKSENSIGKKISNTTNKLGKFISKANEKLNMSKSKMRKCRSTSSVKSLVSKVDLIRDVHFNKASLGRNVSKIRNSDYKYRKLLTL